MDEESQLACGFEIMDIIQDDDRALEIAHESHQDAASDWGYTCFYCTRRLTKAMAEYSKRDFAHQGASQNLAGLRFKLLRCNSSRAARKAEQRLWRCREVVKQLRERWLEASNEMGEAQDCLTTCIVTPGHPQPVH